ncbi:MAG: metal-dependent hydrolase [Candidatus Hodarchaeales archaeon]|jgi:hypothetical protein
MTWFTSHLALEGLVAWVLIGKNLRNRFLDSNKTKILFLVSNLFAIMPDLDVYLSTILPGPRIHRGPSHSLFFPIFFIFLGYIFLILLWYTENRQENSSFFFRYLTDNAWLKLLPYFFFLSAFFWFFHIILDMDSGEGAVMLLWPLDNQLYQVQFLVTFSAFPFLFLPWTPLGYELEIEHSTIQGLLNYLLNWTPDIWIQNTGSTVFKLSFLGLIFHITIFVVYFHVVLRELTPSITIKRSIKALDEFRKIKKLTVGFWEAIPKLLLIPGILLLFIGFGMGPMLGERILDSQESQGTLEFQSLRFSPLFQISFETAGQLLDPNAKQGVSYNFNIINNPVNMSIYFIVAHSTWFSAFWQQNSLLKQKYFTPPLPNNDTAFHEDYLSVRNNILSENIPLIFEEVTTGEKTGSITLQEKNKYGIGFLIYDWVSAPNWNNTDLRTTIKLPITAYYERLVNYWLGVAIELIGLSLIMISLSKRNKNHHTVIEKD